MLGIVLIYWIARKFYDLAVEYEKSKWAFAFLGIGIYYGTQLIFGVLLGIFFPDFVSNMESNSKLGLNLIGVLVGGLVWYFALKYFTKKLENEYESNSSDFDSEIEAIGKEINGKK